MRYLLLVGCCLFASIATTHGECPCGKKSAATDEQVATTTPCEGCPRDCTDCPCDGCPGAGETCADCPCDDDDVDCRGQFADVTDQCKCGDDCQCEDCQCGQTCAAADVNADADEDRNELTIKCEFHGGPETFYVPRWCLRITGVRRDAAVQPAQHTAELPVVIDEQTSRYEENWLLLGPQNNRTARGPVTISDVMLR